MLSRMKGIIQGQRIGRRTASSRRRPVGGRRTLRLERLSPLQPSDRYSRASVVVGSDVASARSLRAIGYDDSHIAVDPTADARRSDRRPDRRRSRSGPFVHRSTGRPGLAVALRAATRALTALFVRRPRLALVGAAAVEPQQYPTADLSIAVALPLALLGVYVAISVIPPRELFAFHAGVELKPASVSSIVALPSGVSRVRNLDPLSVDPSHFEQIRRTEYTVRPGDTVSEIAQRYGLRLDTLMSANTFDDVRRLLPGTVLSIPNRDGVFHAIMPGESLSSIASSYGIPVSAILDANDLRSERLAVGESLFIPGARMDTTQLLLAIGELFQWPVRRFRFTSPYGMRIHPITGLWHLHNGIDLAGPIGTPVLAARSGRVVHMENDTAGYGRMIILDHGGGFRTLYAHLDAFRVRVGQYVSTGQQIGTLGNTGRSTGPHLHFSVIRNGRWEDPMKHLAR